MLFVDLIGSTALAEQRPAEDVRELLSGYYQLARTVVSRYGGTIEKFIGDAVLAVWGSPVAREDDAERCLRAGLEIVDAVAQYGAGQGVELAARGGVATGEVATWASTDEGLVVGDRVNTAARVQSMAPPGALLVDEVTMRTTQAAIAYEPAGLHELRGKDEPVTLWVAKRVVAGAGGAQRVDGLEARFLGRARELALVKELFHATAETGRARLVSVSGVAGVGKSRLSWEFEKYVDGIEAKVWWHRGRCPSYGDGVAYWALTEMVKQRFGIAEEEAPTAAVARVVEGLPRWVPDERERHYLVPRLAALVGDPDPSLSREELYAGWRLFFERLAATGPVVLVVDDLHWADSGLLAFLEYLVDWSATSAIYVVTLTRPELYDHRPGWPGNLRNGTNMHLDPLPDRVMEMLLADLVPAMPSRVRDQVVLSAEGIPLYAVETIRMLIDRGLVVAVDGAYRLVSEVDTLDVPVNLTALLSARLDALPPAERELVKDLAVLGSSFPRDAVSAISNASGTEVDRLLRSLVRKEILTVRSDPLSPDSGQYAFMQTLLHTVAHDRITRAERKARHLAVAAHLRETFADDGEEVIEVIAFHLHDACAASTAGPEQEALRRQAAEAYERAGHRASGIGAPDAAMRAFRKASSLADEPEEAARLTELAAKAAEVDGKLQLAYDLCASAMSDLAIGRIAKARLLAMMGRCRSRLGDGEGSLALLQEAREMLHRDVVGPVLCEIDLTSATSLISLGRGPEADEPLERALATAAASDLPKLLARGLFCKGLRLADTGRLTEALGNLGMAVELTHDHGMLFEEGIARANLSDLLLQDDRPEGEAEGRRCLEVIRAIGDRHGEAIALATLALSCFFTGRWDDAVELASASVDVEPRFGRQRLVLVHAARGELARARVHVEALSALPSTDETQQRVAEAVAQAACARLVGDSAGALELADAAVRDALAEGLRNEGFRLAWPLALDAALGAGQLDRAAELLALVGQRSPGHVPPYLKAQLCRYRALLAIATAPELDVEDDLVASVTALERLAYPYHLAHARADLGRWLRSRGRPEQAEPLLSAAASTYAELGAKPALAALQPSTDTPALIQASADRHR